MLDVLTEMSREWGPSPPPPPNRPQEHEASRVFASLGLAVVVLRGREGKEDS